jgi:site-specific recombinase XerD
MAEQSCLPTTVETYCWWVRKFYAHCGKPASSWTGPDVQAWMLSLHDAGYSAKSRKQALCAAAFVFRHVIKSDMGRLELPPMPRERQTLRTIPTVEEIGRIFAGLRGQVRLMAGVMYGSGLRVSECCHLRVQDVDFAALTIRVHAGKGDKCRLTVLPVAIVPALQRHLAWLRSQHECDLAAGGGRVELPGRLAVKYKSAALEFRWQWLFPSTIVRGQYRWHATPEAVGKQMRSAVAAAGIIKRVTPHTLRHAFATHALRSGNDIATVQELLGHGDMNTTAIYLHADGARGISPMDAVAVRVTGGRLQPLIA